MSACARSLRAQLWPVRGVSSAWRLSRSYESVPRCEQRVLCPSANSTAGRRSLWKSQENPSGVDPHVLIAMLHVEQKSFREPLRHGSDWSNGTSCSGRARPAWMGGGRAKGCLGAHDALLAGLACATGNSKDGDSALPRWWKCPTPISDEEAAHQ